jgi:hypothetical protein
MTICQPYWNSDRALSGVFQIAAIVLRPYFWNFEWKPGFSGGDKEMRLSGYWQDNRQSDMRINLTIIQYVTFIKAKPPRLLSLVLQRSERRRLS